MSSIIRTETVEFHPDDIKEAIIFWLRYKYPSADEWSIRLSEDYYTIEAYKIIKE